MGNVGSTTSGELFSTGLTTDGVVYAKSGGILASTSAGILGQVLTSNGAGVAPTFQAAGGSGGFTPNSTINVFSDFLSYETSVDIATSNILMSEEIAWLIADQLPSSGGAAAVSTNPGVVWAPSLGAGQAFGLFMLGSALGPAFFLGAGAVTCNWVIKLNTLSTVTNRYTLTFGLSSDGVNGNANFIYSDNINSGKYQINTTNGTGSTTTNTNSTATTTGYHNFGITVNAAGTSIGFFIDGVEVSGSPIATHIFTASTLSPYIFMSRGAGTTVDASLAIDLMYFTQTLTTPR